MSEILANIVVQQTDINFQPDVNNINFTPDGINLNIFTAGAPGAGQSSNTELLFNNQNLVDGVPFTSYDGSKLTLGSVNNIKITGGLNTYYLQTDGTGNLNWGVGAGNITGNGVPGGSNTQIQYNDGGTNFGGSAGFTFDKTSNVFSAPGNVNIANNLTVVNTIIGNTINGNLNGTVNTPSQPLITSLGTLSSLNVNGTTSVYQAIENVELIGAQTGTYNFDLLNGSIQYSTANATANLILNFRGSSGVTANSILGVGKSITSTYILTNGSNAYQISSIQIDSANTAIAWVNGSAPLAFANCATAYTFTIIKTSGSPAYKVFTSATRYS